MPFFDLPLAQLIAYKPERTEQPDFDAFWASTLATARQFPLDPRFDPLPSPMALFEMFDVTFNGYGGAPIKGWLILPKQRSGPLPCVVQYLGYGSGRGYVTEWIFWAAAGYAAFIMDNRGQSAYWRGDTADPEPNLAPHYAGFLTQGILDPHTYFYRRLFTDAARAVEVAASHPAVNADRIAIAGTNSQKTDTIYINPAVNADRIAIAGGSQGGGIGLAAGALSPVVSAMLIDVPFLCHFNVAAGLATRGPYPELAGYCSVQRDSVDTVFRTLSYFDGVNFAARGKATALFSVGLMDETCPPRTVFAAYNHYAGEKDIRVYAYNNHEGGGARHDREKLAFLNTLWA